MLTNSFVTIVSNNNTTYTVSIPNATIMFSASATCASTTYSGGRWMTTVPLSGSDEIFISGLLIKESDITLSPTVDLKQSNVTWTGTFSTNTAGLKISWKWGAAVYQNNSTVAAAAANPNLIGVKPTHTNACGFLSGPAKSDHAGTPENIENFVIGGARGGGGSNYTGSWSGTSVTLCASAALTAPFENPIMPVWSVSHSPAGPNLGTGGFLSSLTMTYDGHDRPTGSGTFAVDPSRLEAAYIFVVGGSSGTIISAE